MKEVLLYTDGACKYNPGPGGWGCVLIYKGIEKEIFGGVPDTTNNRMEIFAVIQGLKALKEPCKISIYSDSSYVVNAFKEGWVWSWIKKDWKLSGGSTVKNVDLWKSLMFELQKHEYEFIKVKGHADNKYNNRCDELARGEIARLIKTYGEPKIVEQVKMQIPQNLNE